MSSLEPARSGEAVAGQRGVGLETAVPPLSTIQGRKLRTPRSAGFAGIVFSLLLIVSLVTIRLAIPPAPSDAGHWLTDSSRRDLVLTALALMPFAGIAFLWFVGVVRDRVGTSEDRFFQTLFLGSGLLFVAMLFVAEAVAAGLISSLSDAQTFAATSSWTTGRHVVRELMEGGLQMVGVFTTAAATILVRTEVGARWLGLAGYAISPFLILATYVVPWVALLFPIWVFAVSLDILLRNPREDA